MKKVRFGVVGSGWITDAMINGAKQYDHLELTAVYSRTEQRARLYAERHGAKYTFTDIEEMAKSDVLDMVYIASPNRFHMEQATVFLQNGKHVLCEKSMSAFPQELEAAYCVAQKHNCMLAEAIMLLFQPQWQVLEDAVGALGNLTLARFDFSQLSSKYPAYERGETPNIFNPVLEAGCLQDLGVYCVYPALALFGEPLSTHTSASFLRTGADAAGVSVWEYPFGQVVLTYSKTGQAVSPSEIIGDKGSVVIDSISQGQNIVLHANGQPPKVLWQGDSKETLMGREIAAFAHWVQSGERDDYIWHKGLALQVSSYMYRMRKEANITFPRDV